MVRINLKYCLISFSFLSLSIITLQSKAASINNTQSIIPKGNGTWTYDSLWTDAGKKSGFTPGLFAQAIAQYNNGTTTADHKITQIFSYGNDLEMYCQGLGESDPQQQCSFDPIPIIVPPGHAPKTAPTLFADYNINDVNNKGHQSTLAYAAANPSAIMVPIVDGRFDQTGEDDYLSKFNTNTDVAVLFADKIAKEYCADPSVAGVQFDLEPFDITQPGQEAFYNQIAKDFASPTFGCKNESTYPNGRFFSVFTFANHVTQKIADIFNSYGNGYIVDSLYDLGSTPGGTIKTPAQFTIDAETEIQLMMSNAKLFHMNYQFAIPAGASAHEFESKAGVSKGYLQSDYVQRAFDAINKFSAKQDPYFLGNDIWSWNDKMFWHGDAYTPAKPNDDTIKILQQNL